jgi:hypothetical protein
MLAPIRSPKLRRMLANRNILGGDGRPIEAPIGGNEIQQICAGDAGDGW